MRLIGKKRSIMIVWFSMKIFWNCILLFICLFLVACYGKAVESSPSHVSPSSVTEPLAKQSWQKTEERIVIIFGLGYTDAPFYENTLSVLESCFGLDSEGGLILPLAFPEDFNYEGIAGRISSLPDIIAHKNVKALLSLGAPENTHRALASIQDLSVHNDDFSFPVYSLFPQDDVLGIEAGSHVVIDFAPFGGSHGLSEESGLQHMDLIASILVSIIEKAADFPAQASSTQIQNFLKTALGPSWQVEISIDPETSIRSKNHFLISLPEADSENESVVSGLLLLQEK